ncbi:hypothetical protein DCC39_16395 [Pueribacillus theae]|uniref:DUF304 domain-containing protein n=1 Tax=Pueribacillus theae TaxID=2171751 RepID=A0A2U1JR32_9BACI|nr:DUF6141 family protein [Pueribacillus theae]PWA07611.1 hypothetical protein DCC39_16395 [Pueribacillus theae]
MGKHTKVVFREIQRPRQILWMLILLQATFMWYWFIQQIIFGVPMGNKPAPDVVTIIFWVIFGIVFPVFMLGIVKLITEVRIDGLYIRFVPFHFKYKQYLFKDILHYESITYSPLKRFGGWGIRFNLNGETAYNMNGKKGIELKLKYNTVVVGTQKPNELKKALDSVQRTI